MNLTSYQKAALKFDHHLSLTANAGSGKTFILSKRYVDIAVKENLSLHNIVAITFTEKAASELYTRIAKEIDERTESITSDAELKILNRIRRQLVSANISTIHSFCINILKEFPLEANIDANFIPVDPLQSGELIDISINEYINKNLDKSSEASDLKFLLRLFGARNIFLKQIKLLIEKRKNILSLEEKLYKLDQDGLAEFYRKIFEEKFNLLVKPEIIKVISTLTEINREVLNSSGNSKLALEAAPLLSNFNFEDIAENIIAKLFELKNIVLKKTDNAVIERGYLNKDGQAAYSGQTQFIQEFFNSISDFFESNEPQKSYESLAAFGRKFINVFSAIVEIYELKKSQNGYLDFEDILLKVKEILKNKDVQKSLQQKFQYIMIDEYQDTNEIQYEIFMPVLDYLQKGNLFIVGDEKQSIYKFRDADLELFNRTKNDIKRKENSESLLVLPHSFRVSPPIAYFANSLFEKLFSKPKIEFNEVAPSELICARPDEEGQIEIILSGEDSLPEAELVARRILNLIAENNLIKLGDVAILCRKRDAFTELEVAFNKYNIPFSIVGGRGFFQKQFVLDIFNYLAFLLNESNDTAFIGLLRSPFINLSDDKIFLISLASGKSWFEKFISYASGGSSLTSIVSRLKNNLLVAKKIEVPVLIRKIITESGYLAVIAASEAADQTLANIDKLIRISANFTLQGYKTIFDFVEYLRDAIENRADEGQAAADEFSENVKIMTIHQSKGLEFKSVFIYRSNDVTQSSKVKAKSVSADKELGLLTKLPAGNDFFSEYKSSPVINIYDFVETRKELAEVKRLLYVAVTRAVNYLFISATGRNNKFRKNSFIDLILTGMGINQDEKKYNCRGELKFLEKDSEGQQKEICFDIPVIRSIDDFIASEKTVEKFIEADLSLVKEFEDYPKKEIISATKVAVFSQCPLKYKLTYELGYSKLFRKFSGNVTGQKYEYQSREEETHGYADVKGIIIHKILEEETDLTDLEKSVLENIDLELNSFEKSASAVGILKQQIIEDVTSYYKSDIYFELKKFNKFKNEFEIYTKENENFLYGIIDRLIIENDRIIIVDYKTDDIKKEKINDRAANYIPQLTFYAYVVSKKYPEIKNIELKIVFIKHPDNVYSVVLKNNDLEDFKLLLSDFITKTLKLDFPQNKKHCGNCYFYIDKKKCVADIDENFSEDLFEKV